MSKINIWEKQKKDLYVQCNTNKKILRNIYEKIK